MKKLLHATLMVIPCITFSGLAVAQGDTGAPGNTTTTNSLAGVNQSKGPVGTGVVNRNGPDTGASGGNKNTTNGLAGINTRSPGGRPTE